MRLMAAVLMFGLVGCKKHDSPAAAGSAGLAAVVGSAGSAGSSTASPDPWAGSGSAEVVGSAGSAATAPATSGKLGSDVMDHETIGGIALGADPDKVTAALGKPAKKSKAEEESATGDTVQVWSYGASQVTMSKREGRWGASAIQVAAPTDWKTSRGIGVGSTKAEVLAAYDGEVQDDGVLVGSTYGGELFTMKDGKVTQIFLGAMAE